jgi:hypothetical protein
MTNSFLKVLNTFQKPTIKESVMPLLTCCTCGKKATEFIGTDYYCKKCFKVALRAKKALEKADLHMRLEGVKVDGAVSEARIRKLVKKLKKAP